MPCLLLRAHAGTCSTCSMCASRRRRASRICPSPRRRHATGKTPNEHPTIQALTQHSCRTREGVKKWTDELDDYASECADWAITGEPSTIYPAASKFASFCDNFYDACRAPAATTLTATEAATETETATEEETETAEPQGSETEPTGTEETGAPEPTDAGVQLRVGSAGFLVVALAFVAIW